MIKRIYQAISELAHAFRESSDLRKNEFEWRKLHSNFTTKQDLEEMEQRMVTKLDEILEDIEEQKTLIAGVGTLVSGLKQQLADALAGVSLPPEVANKIEKIWADTEANRAALSEALVANTPPVEPPVE